MYNTNVRVEFRITGDNFDVNEITKTLGITPTETWNKGEPMRQTGKRYKFTMWEFAMDPEESLNINTQLKKIAEKFIPRADILCRLRDQYDLNFCIDIVIVIENNDPPAIYLKSPIIEFAAKIGAMIDMDIYVN